MKPLLLIITICFSNTLTNAQEIIELSFEMPNGITWEGDEKTYYSEIWKTEVVTNVSKPTMRIFKPSDDTRNGTAVIIAPGGGLYAHSIESEGNQVAEWLNSKGITAFVLKYRLVPTGDDGVAEISDLSKNNPLKLIEEVSGLMPFSIADGLNAISYVRSNAAKLGVDPKRIGFLGFSAGGAVTLGVASYYSEENRPDFLVPVYPWTSAIPLQKPRKDVPPTLIICATDDPLDLAAGSIQLYNSWLSQGLSVGLHMYSKGGHGFGMKKQGLPADDWIMRFYEWSVAEGLTIPRE